MRKITVAEDSILSSEEAQDFDDDQLTRAKVASGIASAEQQGTVSSAEARKRLAARLLANRLED